MSKILKWFLALVAISGTILFIGLHSKESQLTDCPFCNPKILESQKFYEDELVVVLYTHRPIFPGHSLIIPKNHIERFEMLSEAEIAQIGQVIKKVNRAAEKAFGTSTYMLLQKNGKEVGQSVPHLHFHYIPRQAGDDSTLKFIVNACLAYFGSPLKQTEMQKVVEQMKMAIDNDKG